MELKKYIENNHNGNLNGPNRLTVYDPNDIAKTTIKETNIHNERDGLYTSYYTTGKKRYEANYEMGRLNGVYTKYNKNGKLISEVNYVQGTKEGFAKYYDLKGKLLYTLTYKNGVVVKVQ